MTPEGESEIIPICPKCKCSAFAYIGDYIFCFVCHNRWDRKTGKLLE